MTKNHKNKKESESEFDRFDSTMRQLMNVSHDDLKAKLDAEKATKKQTKKRRAPKNDPPN